jgi:DNA (cytosine-5)-methyltransferase 1
MKVVELFAGVGGFRLGLERAGHRVVWSNEWDRFAADTYDKNFPGAINRMDITSVPAASIPAHDLICGGFPCQAFSIAGKRRGFEETRGTLFFEIMRIARHHRTTYLLLENVKGLLSHDGGRTFATIITALDELGYDCQWQVLNSKDFGVPQDRERIFIVGHLRNRFRPAIFPLGQGDGNRSQGGSEGAYTSTLTARYGHTNARGTFIKQINPGVAQDHRVYDSAGISPTLNPAAAAGGAVIPKIGYRGHTPSKPDEIAKTVKAGVHGVPGGEGLVDEGYRVRRLTPVECERLQGFPDNWTQGVSDTQRYKQMGNAVTVNVIEAIAQRLPV